MTVADLIQHLTDHDPTSPVRVVRADHDGPITDETGAARIVAHVVREAADLLQRSVVAWRTRG